MDLIEIKNFKKSYGGNHVHKNVSFSVRAGECYGLLGGSGVGKSVILRSIIGLEKPDQGEVMVEGENICSWSENKLTAIRKKVAYVFQNGALFDSMTVFENLAYPLREHTDLGIRSIRDRIIEQLAEFGLEDSGEKYPAELSGGMQKRIGLARAIITKPKIILYDEPTAGLDPYNTRIIQDLIFRFKKRKVTSILVTHDMPTAEAVCDRIGLLKHGSIEAFGKTSELKNDPNGPLSRFIEGRSSPDDSQGGREP